MTGIHVSRSRLAACAIAVALSHATGPPLIAQRVLTVDLGGSAIRYADTLSTTAISVSPMLRLQSGRASLQASGSLSQLDTGGWTTQGALGASLYTPKAGPLVGEVAGVAGGSAHQDATRTGQMLAIGRAHFIERRFGVFAGVGAGATWDGDVWRRVRQAEAGAWAAMANASALLTATPTEVDDSIAYVDVQLGLRWELQRIETAAFVGSRLGDRLPTLGGTAKSWGGISLTAWVRPWLAVVAGAGTYAVDLTQGFPGGRYAMVGVRFGSPRGVPSGSAVAAANGHASAVYAERGILEFGASRAADGRHVLRVRAPLASRVEVSGDFTQWQPIPLSRSPDGWWVVTLPIPRGTYQLNLRLDGGAWRVPPGLTVVTDEFGGTAGLLVVG